jgi:hypothetical protein
MWLLGVAGKNNASSSTTNPRYKEKWHFLKGGAVSFLLILIRATCTRIAITTPLSTFGLASAQKGAPLVAVLR